MPPKSTPRARPSRPRSVLTYDLRSAEAREAFEEELDLEDEARQAKLHGKRAGPPPNRPTRGSFSLAADLPLYMQTGHDAYEDMREYETPAKTNAMCQLIELFGATLDRELIEATYDGCNQRFEQAMERLFEMAASANEGGPGGPGGSQPGGGGQGPEAAADAAASAAAAFEEGPCRWDELPCDVQRHVFSFLGSRDLARTARTCKGFADPARQLRTNTRQLQIPPGLGMHGIMSMVAGHPNARSVSLRQWAASPLCDADFTGLVVALSAGSRSDRRLVPVEALSFKGCRWLSDGHVMAVADTMQHLKEVDLTDCVGITDAALIALAKYQRLAPQGGDTSDDDSDPEPPPQTPPGPTAAATAGRPPRPGHPGPAHGPGPHTPAPAPPSGPSTSLAHAGSAAAAVGEEADAEGGGGGGAVDDELQFELEEASPAPGGGGGGRPGRRGSRQRIAAVDDEEGEGEESEEEEEEGAVGVEGVLSSGSDEEEEGEVVGAGAGGSRLRGSGSLPSPSPSPSASGSLARAFGTSLGISPGAAGGGGGSLPKGSLGGGAAAMRHTSRASNADSMSQSSTPLYGTSPAGGGGGGLLGSSYGAARAGGAAGANPWLYGTSPGGGGGVAAPGTTPGGSGAKSWLYGTSPVMGASPFFRTGGAGSISHNGWLARAASAATHHHSGRGLMSVNLSGCSAVSSDGVRALMAAPLTKACLLQLDISRCPRITRAALALPATSNLCVLRASGCHNLHEVILQLPLTSPLTELHLADCKALTKLHVVAPALQQLHVGSCRHLTRLHLRCPNLRHLTASLCFRLVDLDPDRWEVGRLEHVNLFGCRHLAWPGLAVLLGRAGPALRHLDLNGCNALVVVDIPGALSGLRHLDASGCKALTALRCASPALTAAALRACPRLQELSLDSTVLTRLDVSNCPMLQVLRIPALAAEGAAAEQERLDRAAAAAGAGPGGGSAGPGASWPTASSSGGPGGGGGGVPVEAAWGGARSALAHAVAAQSGAVAAAGLGSGGGRSGGGAAAVVAGGRPGVAVRLAGCDRLQPDVVGLLRRLRDRARQAEREREEAAEGGKGAKA
ncbi:hypothetical protein HYH03_017483 [Edaphochlamys debaryana]|uniref:F-box domain-containing protein n=1 Tax=Edaphochlamys debaryana TaxID=47281 RepID=A0A835XMH0_9CHLO|nr:hypothetical protein HYH03_017483 [Edaphochlamys debaryana]|eukprot:KAG2483680.1 hypothetical protein HYH03_017483 [Edaphochlamys debaryana]